MTDGAGFAIRKNCPKCRNEESVFIEGIHLNCHRCGFSVQYHCPICDRALTPDTITSQPEPGVKCAGCGTHVAFRRLQYLIQNGLIVDHKERCVICHGPTIHRKDMNLSHRCFFYPKCSGQADLFGSTRESLVFIDFETTGLEIAKDNIIEVGALKMDAEGYEHTFQTFVKPVGVVTGHISKITGITGDMVENAPPLKKVVTELVEFIGDAKVVAHNVEFDLPWLCSSILRHDIPLANRDVVCTYQWARANNEPHCSLTSLTKKYAIGHQNAHRALADAVATKELFFIFENFRKAPRPVRFLNTFFDMSKQLVKQYEGYVQP